MSVAEHEAGPRGMPPIAFTYEVDGQPTLRSFGAAVPVPYPDASTAPPANVSRSLRKGYYAAVSWTDHQVGRLLDALDEEQRRTIGDFKRVYEQQKAAKAAGHKPGKVDAPESKAEDIDWTLPMLQKAPAAGA